MWLVRNIQQDQKEQAEIVKQLCMFIQPGAFSEEKDFNIKKSVSTEISKDIKAKTGMSAEEIEMVLTEDAERLELYSPIEGNKS